MKNGQKGSQDQSLPAKHDSYVDHLSYVSHELRTPINGIVGMTNFLLDSSLTTEQIEWVRTIKTCSESLLDLVTNILDISKIDAGKMHLEKSKCDLTTLIEECMDIVAPILNDKPVTMFNCTARNCPATLLLDANRVRQIICNLLGNAAKFTEKGSIGIFTYLSEKDGNKCINIDVRDTGCGIAPDDMKQLFKPFVQLKRSERAKIKGTGLGLIISKKIAELLGGDLTLESTLGVGSCFTISIPIENEVPSINKTISDCNLFLVTKDNDLKKAITSIASASFGYAPIIMPEIHDDIIRFVRSQSGRFVIIVDQNTAGAELDEVTSLIRNIRKIRNFERTPVILLKKSHNEQKTLSKLNISSISRAPLKHSVLVNYIRELAETPAANYNFVTEEAEREQRISQKYDTTLLNSLHILVAEDDPISRKVLELTLKKIGISADFAVNGIEAVEAASRHQYPLILMDCQMPEIDGLEATKVIRQLPGYADTPILALTAESIDDGKNAALAAGFSEYLVKPLKIHELFRAIKSHLTIH